MGTCARFSADYLQKIGRCAVHQTEVRATRGPEAAVRASPRLDSMKSIEFYDLPRAVQERFISASQAALAPAPLAVRIASGYVGLKWFLAALAGFVLTIAYVLRGLGDLEHGGAIASGLQAALYGLGFTLSFACLSRGLTLRDRALSLPFTRATYLFPVGVIRAESATLELHSLQDLERIEASSHALELSFAAGARFSFPAKTAEQATLAKDAVTRSKERLGEAQREESMRELAALDPLCQTRFPSPFSTGVPFKRPAMAWTSALFGMALVSGAALGVGVWKIRNIVSEGRIAATAHQDGSAAAFRKYLERGGTRQDIVETYLPRAELREAEAQGNVAAIERYITEHADSKIGSEVATALRVALLRELESAKASGTLASLDDFARRFPRHDAIAQELAEARHAVYERAAERAASLTVERGRRNDPADFVRRLVAFAEKNGPRVELRFRSRLNKTTKRADTQVRESSYFAGKVSVPSQYFDGPHMREREKLLAPLLLEPLQSLFAPEIVRFEHGEPLPAIGMEDDETPLPEPTVATLYIDQLTELSGGVTVAKPRGIFLNAAMFVDTDFVIPGDSSKLSIKLQTWRAPDRRVMTHRERTIDDVYEDLSRRSLNLVLRRYLAAMMKDPPERYMPKIPLRESDDKDDKEQKDDEG